jgi:tripartite-type tricarboxylate transporter receptor subunit TctC
VLVVNSASAMMSVKDLIAAAKAKPGTLNCTAGGVGGSNHLAAELFKSMAGVNFLVINYKSAGLALTALIGNQAQLMFSTASAAAPHIKAGRLRSLGVTTAQPSVLAPGMPTVAASGLPGYEAVSVYGFFAPAKTPAAIINRLNQETIRYLNKADVKEKLVGQGIEVIAGTPQQLTSIMKTEITRLGKVIKETGMKDVE